jgi:23S rRNA (cytidine1920-2'-O)/16S rRNA (cytidine1409-2'-O)-methyltransferase
VARRHHRHFVPLVDRLGFASVEEANAAIVAGQVTVNGIPVSNPDALIGAGAVVALATVRTLRGTVKLRSALARFGAKVSGQVCLDLGAAAGGFTVALLEAGARKVYAVDVGYGQLASWLRQDNRVVNLERTNLAHLGRAMVPEPVEVICLDLSYLALADAVPRLSSLELSEHAQLFALVKPTFELHASSMIADDEAIDKAVVAAAAAAERCGWSVSDTTAPVAGARGAREVFLYGTRQENL